MKFDFNRVIDRRTTNDIKWNHRVVKSSYDSSAQRKVIPLWIADMDFACPPCVVNAIRQRAEKEIFGYCAPPQSYFEAVGAWYLRRYGWQADPKRIVITPSVVAAVNIAIRAFTDEGDGVIIQQPVYDPFADTIKKTGRAVVNNALRLHGDYYEMDYALLEEQAADPRNKLLILCSPHNPVGRVWREAELRRLDEICRRHGVLILSDEIHADIVFKGHRHTAFPSLSQEAAANCIHCSALNKAFNVPGLKTAHAFLADEAKHAAFTKMQDDMSLSVRNTFGLEAIAAYSDEGAEWLAQMVDYLEGNIALVDEAVGQMPGVSMRRPEGTFLCWIDFRETGYSDAELQKRLLDDAGLFCLSGSWFGEGGDGYIRMNIGCTRSTLAEALGRMRAAF